ncbi:serine hydrolase domain-containing protein [Sphingomonas sp. 35-24ZXX]|uniref:serine hydrolase domain-containing protein n=1 Tax=Sphingomonas sp. 35-24ZXX TaxID=1545915 RepID=UPI00068BF8D9|nr:serine hydrolase domain-containing protein [Sphingomonas sp. 35-24ZXX]
MEQLWRKRGLPAFAGMTMQVALAMAAFVTPVHAQADDNVAIELKFAADQLGRAKVSGLAHRPSMREATLDDPVRIASISKLAVGVAVMRLVDKQALDLDRDVSLYLGWRLVHPQFPAQKITLRLLLSHQSGLKDDAGYFIPLDAKLADLLAKPEAWDAGHAPGAYFRYANVNYPVIAAVMEAATGRRFDRIMTEELFEPLDIPACYNWSGCRTGAAKDAITLYNPDGSVARDDWIGMPDQCAYVAASNGACDLEAYLPGQNGSAFSPQGGLRISAGGLARLGQMLLSGGDGLLTPESFAELIRAQWRFDGSNGDDDHGYFTAFGLGVQRIEKPDGQVWIGHPGEAYGLRAGLWVNRASGEGVVRISTGHAEDDPIGHCLDACP